jgi:hypothetical protein
MMSWPAPLRELAGVKWMRIASIFSTSVMVIAMRFTSVALSTHARRRRAS